MFPNKRLRHVLPNRLRAAALAAWALCLALSLVGSLAGSLVGTATGARAEDAAEAKAYRDCIALVEKDPAAAYEQAAAWASQGGGDPARHCGAVALIQLGHYEKAGRRLEDLAQTMRTEELRLRVEALAQAAQAWMLAGKEERAFAAQTAALKLAPDNLELLIDRSIVLASAENYRAALLDLDRAYALAPQRPDVLVYRATVHRFLDSSDAALRDIQSAILLDPNMPEAYLERGILKRLQGDRNGARRDWVKVLDLGAGSPAADAARVNLELLDVNAGAGGTADAPPAKLDPPTSLITSPPPAQPAPAAARPALPALPSLGAPRRADPE